MWELQPLSNNRRTTEISLLLGENTSLTISQIPHNFVGLLSLLSLYLLSSFSLVVSKISLDALPIYRQASKQRIRGKASGTNWCCKWHRIGAHFVDLASTNWCQLASQCGVEGYVRVFLHGVSHLWTLSWWQVAILPKEKMITLGKTKRGALSLSFFPPSEVAKFTCHY